MLKKIITDNKFYFLALGAILVFYLATRLFNIMSLPMFTDEAIYTRWAQIAENDFEWLFISLTDGKQPLFVWADMLMMKIVPDPLLAGRLVSVVAGLLTTIGMFFLGSTVFRNKKIGIISSFLYVLYPFALVYDRMALYDTTVTLFFTWGILFTVLLIRKISLTTAVSLGIIAGLGTLNKSSGFFTIYLLPFSLLLFDYTKKWRKKLLKWALFALIATVITYLAYNFLRISPFFYIVDIKNATFVYPISEWIKQPFTYFFSNMNAISRWTIIYLSLQITALVLISFFTSKKYLREKIYLLFLYLAPAGALILFGRTLFPRYIFFMTAPLLILAAHTLVFLNEKIKNIFIKISLCILIFTFWLRADYFILTDFARAPIPKSDTDQYANKWPAGGGYREMVEFFKDKAENEKIFVATEGTFGSLPTYSIEIYLGENKNIEKKGFYPIKEEIPKDLLEKTKKMPVYFVFNETQSPPTDTWPLEFIKKYQKGIGDDYMRIYKVVPEK